MKNIPIKLMLALASFLLAPFLASLFVGYFILGTIGNQTANLSTKNVLGNINQRIEPIVEQINNLSRTASNNVMLLSSLSEAEKAVNTGEISSGLMTELTTFLQHEPMYAKLVYYDKNGTAKVLATSSDQAIVFAKDSELSTFKTSDCFQKAWSLKKGEVYISPIQLGDNSPVVHYATPLFNTKDEKIGVVTTIVDANYFLDEVRTLNREGDVFLLIDQNGDYLANPERSKEIGFNPSKAYNFFTDYPSLKDKITSISYHDSVELNDELFTFHYIYPTLGSFAINKGSEKIIGNNPENNFYWILVSVSKKYEITKQIDSTRSDYLTFMLISSGISVFFLCTTILFFLKIYSKQIKFIFKAGKTS